MPRMNHNDAIDLMAARDNYGLSIFREGGAIVVAIGARHGQAHCAYMNLHQAREMAEALQVLAAEIENAER